MFGALRHAAGDEAHRLHLERFLVGAADVVDERTLEDAQEGEGGDGEHDGERRGGEHGDAQTHRSACPAEPAPRHDVASTATRSSIRR